MMPLFGTLAEIWLWLKVPVTLVLAAVTTVIGGLRLTTVLPGPRVGIAEACAPCTATDDRWIAFCARPESAWGHGVILIGEGETGAVAWEEAWGLYPEVGIGLPGAVPRAMLQEDPATVVQVATHRLEVRISYVQEAELRDLLAQYSTPGDFHVMRTDCIEMLEQMARSLELTTPRRAWSPMPQAWVQELVALNMTR